MIARHFKTLKIAGKRHRVQWDQELGDLAGEIEASKLLIRIGKDLGADEERETLLHEVMHGICHQMNVKISEDQNRQLSIGVFETMRNNPALVDYLFGEGDDGSD